MSDNPISATESPGRESNIIERSTHADRPKTDNETPTQSSLSSPVGQLSIQTRRLSQTISADEGESESDRENWDASHEIGDSDEEELFDDKGDMSELATAVQVEGVATAVEIVIQDEEHSQTGEDKEGNEEGFEDDGFEEGFDDDDFGDFDDFEEHTQETQVPGDGSGPAQVAAPQPQSSTVHPCLLSDDFSDSVQLQARVLANLQSLYAPEGTDQCSSVSSSYASSPKFNPASNTPRQTASPPLPAAEKSAVYFTERSYSLWKQLALMNPQMHTVDWRRSSIRRLLLLSLGIPLDLDQVLPKKDTKHLVLPSAHKRSQSAAVGGRQGQGQTKNQEGGSASGRSSRDEPKIEDFDEETESNLARWRTLAEASSEALDNMSEDELTAHLANLKAAMQGAEKICMQWQIKKDAVEKDKEAFEGVIESLLEYAQRLRRNR